jgi:hypothetical protein
VIELFTKLLAFTKKVSDFADHVTGNASANKAQFDAAPEELRSYFNNLVDSLKSTARGDSGAKNIGVTSISNLTGNDIQTILESLNTIVGYQTNNIPHLHIEMIQDYAIQWNLPTALYQGNFLRTSVNGGWIDQTDKWVVPVSGVYNVSGFLAMAPSANAIELQCSIYTYNTDNSVKGYYAVGVDNANNNKWVYAGGSMNVYLNAGEKIALVATQDSAGWQTLKRGRLTAVLVGKY